MIGTRSFPASRVKNGTSLPHPPPHTNARASTKAGRQAGRQAGRKAGRQAGRQAGRHGRTHGRTDARTHTRMSTRQSHSQRSGNSTNGRTDLRQVAHHRDKVDDRRHKRGGLDPRESLGPHRRQWSPAHSDGDDAVRVKPHHVPFGSGRRRGSERVQPRSLAPRVHLLYPGDPYSYAS